jgi:hypothetical protein
MLAIHALFTAIENEECNATVTEEILDSPKTAMNLGDIPPEVLTSRKDSTEESLQKKRFFRKIIQNLEY